MTGREAPAQTESGAGSAYTIATALSVGGTAVGMLVATGAITLAAGTAGNEGLATATFLALALVAAAVTVPHAPSLAHRFGSRRMFVVGKSTGAVLWLGGGLLILGGAPPVAVLYCLAPLMGVAIGTTQVITPLLTKAYLAAAGSMSATWARIKAFSAIGAATGALGGGVLLNAGTFGWGLVLNSALTLPLIVVVWRIDPAGSFQEPRPSERAWRDIRTLVRSNRALRLAFINASLVSVVVAPPLLLVVPITNDLRPGAVLVGAGILRASLYLGEFLVPLVVRRSTRQRSDLEGSILTGAGAAAVLVLLALTALILTRGVELVAWVAIGIGLGSLRYGSRAMTVGTATDAVEPGQQVHAIAAISVAAQLAAPVGLLLWGLCIDGLSATTALLAFGAVGIASAGLLRARLPR